MPLCDLIGHSTLLELAQGFGLVTPSPRMSWVESGHETNSDVPENVEHITEYLQYYSREQIRIMFLICTLIQCVLYTLYVYVLYK